MDPLTIGLLGGAALGLGKGVLDQGRESKDRQIAAAEMRYSPWTGMKPQEVQRADPVGSTMQGATSGAMMGQGFQNMQNQQALQQAQTGYYNRMAQPLSSPTVGGTGGWMSMNPNGPQYA